MFSEKINFFLENIFEKTDGGGEICIKNDHIFE